jgi:hypothetical protein
VPDPHGAKRRLDGLFKRGREAGERDLVAADVDRRAVRDDDEDARVSRRAALRGDDGIPLPRARDPGDAGFNPAERARVFQVAAQGSWGSISP